MKTTKFFSVLSLALIFATANTAFSSIPEKPVSHEDKANLIIFEVNVHLTVDLAFCGTYQVRLVFPDGSLVAAPQTYIPGKTTYMFSKAPWPSGVHPMYVTKVKITAMLLPVSANDEVCPVELNTRPDSEWVWWTGGQSARFDLYPNQILKKNETAARNNKE